MDQWIKHLPAKCEDHNIPQAHIKTRQWLLAILAFMGARDMRFWDKLAARLVSIGELRVY